MKNICIVCLLILLGISPMVQGQEIGLSHRMEPELPRYSGRVLGPVGQSVCQALVTLKYGQDSVRVVSGFLGEFWGEISEIPDTLLIRVEAEGFKTSEYKYPAKEKGDNYLTLQVQQEAKVLNELFISSDKIQVKLNGKTLEYPNKNYKVLRGDFERDLLYDHLPGYSNKLLRLPDNFLVSRPCIKKQFIHCCYINKEGWNEEELALEKIMTQAANKRRRYVVGVWNNNNPNFVKYVEQWGYVGRVRDYLARGNLPYARVCLIAGEDTVRLTCDALGYFSWKTSKIFNTVYATAEGYGSAFKTRQEDDDRACIYSIGLAPKTIKGLNHVIILDDKVQIKLQDKTLEYPIGVFKTLEGDFVGDLLREIPGVAMDQGFLSVNGQPIHYISVNKENISTSDLSILKNKIDNIQQSEKK